MSEAKNPAQETPNAGEAASKESVTEQKPVATEGAEATKADAEPKQPEADPKVEAKPDAPAEPKKVVPDKYDLKLPEAAFLDASHVEKIAAIAREQGFSNEEAQAFLEKQNTAVGEAYASQSEAWMGQVKDDKEIGGAALTESVELAKRVVERFGTDTLKTELNRTGYGNHPELIRLLTRIGKAMSEDKLVIPGAQSGGRTKSLEDIFYGQQTQ